MERNTVVCGDNIAVLQNSEWTADLIVIDPPYCSNRDYKDSAGVVQFSDKWRGMAEYLDYMREILNLCFLHLSPTGSMYLHVDATASHYLKVEMDRIFGMQNFRRHITWAGVNSGGFKSTAKNWIRTSDHILFYTKSDDYVFNRQYLPLKPESQKRYNLDDGDGRKYLIDSKSKQRFYLDQSKGTPLTDCWTDIDVRAFADSTGYPTQKPLKLLERIIAVSSNEGDLVMDCFCGSGSTLVAAKNLDRDYCGVDKNPAAVLIAEQRLMDEPSAALFNEN